VISACWIERKMVQHCAIGSPHQCQTEPHRVVFATGRTPPLSCQRPTDRAYQKRTKYRQIYRYFPLLALSNLFRVNSRWVDGDRVKMALYR
jgi:hypothetical protein